MKTWLKFGLSLAAAVGILAWLLSRQNWAELSRTIVDVDWRWIAALGALTVLYWWIRVTRWRWMTALEQTPVSPGTAWVSMLAGLGVGLYTPLRGGEIIRPMFVPRGARVRLAGWVLIERMFDLSAVLTLVLIGVVYAVFAGGVKLFGDKVLPAWILLLCPLLLAGALAGPLLIHFRPGGLWRMLGKALPGKVKELANVRLSRRQFGIFFLSSLLAEAVSVLTVFFCLRAFDSGREIGLLTACALSPLVMLHNIIPATPGGFGVRETFATLIFCKLFGFNKATVLAAYLTNPLVVLVLPGAIGIIAAWVTGVTRHLALEPAE
ncbi:MAG TPA: lysylphosphatidylglycerol synthase transmembrane domain-containing protein [Phycisphaerae bacterium]|nr:lysylphosphatidylglycerol synthase transmembrane domain-containing protein [Phycisphaerae bacterium]